jgi:hypothetical protein
MRVSGCRGLQRGCDDFDLGALGPWVGGHQRKRVDGDVLEGDFSASSKGICLGVGDGIQGDIQLVLEDTIRNTRREVGLDAGSEVDHVRVVIDKI